MMKFAIALSLFLASASAACDNPEVQATGYTPADSQGLSDITYIAEFTLSCVNDEKPVLYADIEGTFQPVITSADGLKYQVIWIGDEKKPHTGNITVDLYDSEGYAAANRARDRGDASTTEPLVTFVVSFPDSAEPTVKPASYILIGVFSGLTAGISNEFILRVILRVTLQSSINVRSSDMSLSLTYDLFSPHNDFSHRQVLALAVTWLGSCGVSMPFWLSFWDIPNSQLWDATKQIALFGALLNSAGLILLGPLPFTTFTTNLIGVVLYGAGQAASALGGIAYATYGFFIAAMFLGWKVGEALFSSNSITFASAIHIIIFMEMVSMALFFFY